ncbi:hypothetical protein PQF34_002169 [Klebsiella aerogenes]|nr:hypothetical protein [Klebsiella aerogenes]
MYNETTEKLMKEAQKAREKLAHKPGILVTGNDSQNLGLYLSNYANCLLNRQIDIFDDAILLLKNQKIPSASTISRGMIETYAFSRLLFTKVAKVLNNQDGKESVDKSLKIILEFTNSSRFKVDEQKKIKDGTYDPNDYSFTEEAINRFQNMLASSEHVMNALRELYKEEMKYSQEKESTLELIYNALSEWVHPSQTSIFHNYVPETHKIHTSLGMIHLFDSARHHCALALHLITDSMNVYDSLLELADEITRRSTVKS